MNAVRRACRDGRYSDVARLLPSLNLNELNHLVNEFRDNGQLMNLCIQLGMKNHQWFWTTEIIRMARESGVRVDFYSCLSLYPADGPFDFMEAYRQAVMSATTLEDLKFYLPVPTIDQPMEYRQLVDEALDLENDDWPFTQYLLSLGVTEEFLTNALEIYFTECDDESTLDLIDQYVEAGFDPRPVMDALWQAQGEGDHYTPILHHLFNHYQMFDDYCRQKALEIYFTEIDDEDHYLPEEDREMIMAIVQLGFTDPGGFLVHAGTYTEPDFNLLTPTFDRFEQDFMNKMIQAVTNDDVHTLYFILREEESEVNATVRAALEHQPWFIERIFRFCDQYVQVTLPQLLRVFPDLSAITVGLNGGGWMFRGYSQETLTNLFESTVARGIHYQGLKMLVDRGARVTQRVVDQYADRSNRYDVFLLIPDDDRGRALKQYVVREYPEIQRQVVGEVFPDILEDVTSSLNRLPTHMSNRVTQFLV